MVFGLQKRISDNKLLMATMLFAAVCGFCSCRGMADITLADNGKAAVELVLANDATLQEKTAAEELQKYLQKITSAKFTIVAEKEAKSSLPGIFIGQTEKARNLKLIPAKPEAWVIKTIDGNLILCGGRPRGTLYAVYHFLEDILCVHWWSPQEESVPVEAKLSIPSISQSGEPVFARRCMNMNMVGYDPPSDRGDFVVRNRMNSRGPFEGLIDIKYGSDDSLLISPRPWCAHSFDAYIPDRDGLFKTNPEYFALRDGKRSKETYDLTSSGLRDYMAAKLKQFIQQDSEDAAKRGRPRPFVYNFSKEDQANLYSDSPESIAIREREGSESGVMLDFINDQAKRVRKYDPNIIVETLAYQNTEQPPKLMSAEDNVMITLCDTESIITLPITHPRNKEFADKVRDWGKKTKHLRIWDYGFGYMPDGWEYPMPMEFTYQSDYKFFLSNGVQGIFTQYETFPGVVLGDMPDMKRWLMCKLMEEPYQDFEQLLEEFAEAFYGPAGKYIIEYRKFLDRAAKAKQPGYTTLCATEHTTLHYLDTDFIVQTKEYFRKAEEACNGNPVLLKRVHHARGPVDATEMARYSLLKRQWLLECKDPKEFPLDYKLAAERLEKTLIEQADQRLGKGSRDERIQTLIKKIETYTQQKSDWPLPEQFKKYSANELFEFTPPNIPRVVGPAEVVADASAECGLTIKMPLPDKLSPDTKILSVGIHQQETMPTEIVVTHGPDLKVKNVKKDLGYQWYKVLNNVTVQTDSKCYFEIPECWNVQFQCDTPASHETPEKYDFWAKMKFDGPTFTKEGLKSNGSDKNCLYIERVIMVKRK